MIRKNPRDHFHLIGPGDRISIWWGGRHVWVTVLAVELSIRPRHIGGHYVDGARFTVYNPHSYAYDQHGSQVQRVTVQRVAVLHARRHSSDVSEAYTPAEPMLTPEQHATLLGYHAEHGGPERNCVIPDDVLA